MCDWRLFKDGNESRLVSGGPGGPEVVCEREGFSKMEASGSKSRENTTRRGKRINAQQRCNAVSVTQHSFGMLPRERKQTVVSPTETKREGERQRQRRRRDPFLAPIPV